MTKSIRTIVAALALEADIDLVAERAIQLAQQHEARLILVHVIEDEAIKDGAFAKTATPGPANATALQQMIRQDAAERMKMLSSSAEIIVEVGKPYQIIKAIAERDNADIVIIGPGNAKNIREKIFGSTADRVVRQSSVPVLVVKSPSTGPYEHIIVAVDFSSAAKAAAEAIARLAPDTAFEAVHVFEIPLTFEQAMLKTGTSQAEIERYRRAKAIAARKQMEAEFEKAPNKPRLRVINGFVGDVLVQLSCDKKTELMALGAHSHKTLPQALLGSHAQRVLREAGCDILIANLSEQ